MTATGGLPMTATTQQARSATQPRAWLPVAAALLGIGWGANQITPMLLVYRHALGLGTGTLEAAFGVYALGLIPGLLIAGPLSDTRGRRAVVVPAVALSFLASVLLTGATFSVALLFAGRLLAGGSSGAAPGRRARPAAGGCPACPPPGCAARASARWWRRWRRGCSPPRRSRSRCCPAWRAPGRPATASR